jgi:hypothetical protein
MNRFSKISTFILTELNADNTISEDSLRIFSEEIFTYLNTPMIDPPHSFEELSILLKQYWYANSNTNKNIYSSFVMGFLLGNMELANRKKQLNIQYKQSQTLISQYKKYSNLLSLIAKNKGIMHKELATKLNKSESSLSQIMSRSILQSYIYAYNSGREKYYYLTAEGYNILKAIEGSRKISLEIMNIKVNKDDGESKLSRIIMKSQDLQKQTASASQFKTNFPELDESLYIKGNPVEKKNSNFDLAHKNYKHFYASNIKRLYETVVN